MKFYKTNLQLNSKMNPPNI